MLKVIYSGKRLRDDDDEIIIIHFQGIKKLILQLMLLVVSPII